MLLTIMVLLVLITVVVTFQLDMFLRIRASRYREAKVQCQYAAESGLVMAFKMVEQALEAQRKGDFKAISSIMKKQQEAAAGGQTASEADQSAKEGEETNGEKSELDKMLDELADPNSVQDPNEVIDNLDKAVDETDLETMAKDLEEDPIFDPEAFLDPNRLAEMLETGELLDMVPIDSPLVISKKVFEVGDASVEIEVFDENAKLPLHWNIDSPYLSGVEKDKDLVAKLGRILQVDNKVTATARDLIGKYSRTIPVKGIRKVIYQRQGASLNFRGPNNLSNALQNRPMVWEQQRLRLSYSKAREMEDQQREMMAALTARVNYELAEDDQLADLLNVPVGYQQGVFLDYIGAWGHDKINLNTAPAEVLEAAFGIMGVDSRMAQAIIDRRDQKPFASTYELKQTDGISDAAVSGLIALTTVRSDTFSIHIKAIQGQCECRLSAGIYRDRLGKIKTIAVFKPKG